LSQAFRLLCLTSPRCFRLQVVSLRGGSPLCAVQEETKPDVRSKGGQWSEVGAAGRKREEAEAQEAKRKGAAAAPQEK